MLVDYEAITEYLRSHALILEDRVVESDLVILDASRRNCNVQVISENGPCYFLKQEIRDRSGGDSKLASVAYEAEVYRLLALIDGDSQFCGHLPQFQGFDPQACVLILEAIPRSISFAEYHFRLGRFPPRIAGELGKALATLHRLSEAEKKRIEAILGVAASPPWVLSLGQPHRWLYLHSSGSNLELVRIFQESADLCRAFDELQRQWTMGNLIHGDLKWDNCLLHMGPTSRHASRIKIVDWELARIGDPCWDVGAIFGEYLNFWLSSIPLSGDAPPDQFLALARFPLGKMHPSIRSFWRAYVQHLSLPPVEAENRLLRATKYAGVRLVQTAFEQLQNGADVNCKTICSLQLCANLLTRPMEAAVQLLGLSLPAEVSDAREVY